MNRPHIICHMMTALDGRITGPYLYDAHTQKAIEVYDRIHESFGAKAWICGRKTMEENFTLGAELLLLEGGGGLNGSFLEAGLIDEMSLVLAPLADGCTGIPALFDKPTAKEAAKPTGFTLKQAEPIGDNELWLRYETIK